jgi:hypothetical protein
MRRAARALGVAAGAALCVWLPWRVAHAPLGPLAARVLTGALGVPVSVAAARLVAPATLWLEGVRAGRATAQRLELDADLEAALHGRAALGGLRVVALAVDGLGAVARAEAQVRGRQARVTARDATATLHGIALGAGEIAVEVQDGRARRAAFTQASAAGLDGIAGSASHEPDGSWALRAGVPGLSVTGRIDRGGDALAFAAALDRLPLAPLGARAGLDPTRADASGTLAGELREGTIAVRGDLALRELAVDARALSTARLEHLAPRLALDVNIGNGVVAARPLRVELGALTLSVDGSARLDGHDGSGTVTLARAGCADILRSLPRALVPTLDGLTLDGALAGRLRVAVATDDAGAPSVELAPELDVGCRVLADAPLADPRSLASAAPVRALASLPAQVVRTFVVAEDGRFYRHHGFDVDRIRHALAADLTARRFERGASTITQQLAKNLFLSGERTLGRKLEEAVLAWRLEQVLPKRRMLELYLDLVELGPGIHGLTEGAERYFGKEPEELELDEAAQLAALLPAPRRGMDAAWERRYRALLARLAVEGAAVLPAAAPTKKLATRR